MNYQNGFYQVCIVITTKKHQILKILSI